MATKKTFLVILGLFFITAGFLSFANGVGAETLKLQISNLVTKGEVFPVENMEGVEIVPMVRSGLFVSESGELGSMRWIGVSDRTAGKVGGLFLGYIVFIFGDGSTIMGIMPSGSWWGDPEGKVMGLQKASGELIMGSGRFKAIKGTFTMTGKILKPLKGEIAPKVYNAFILDYTLSP